MAQIEIEVKQPRWNAERNAWDMPGTRISIDESEFPFYAVHCEIIGAGEKPRRPQAESPKADVVFSPPPVKKNTKKKKRK